jgi:hypothetical protein
MKIATRMLLILAATICGCGTGWFLHAGIKGRTSKDSAAAQRTTGESAAVAISNSEPGAAVDEPNGFFDRLHEALGVSNRSKRERMIAGLTEGLDAAEIREALTHLARSRIPNRKETMVQLFARWGELDPMAALEFARSMARTSDQREATLAVLNGWMEVDPVAAEKWVREQPPGSLRNAAWEAVILAYAGDNPVHALALAREIRLSWRNLGDIPERIFGPWALRDPAGAAVVAAQLPSGVLRMDAQRVVAEQWAESDPAKAIEWADTLPDRLPTEEMGFGGMTIIAGADRSNAAKFIVNTWLKRDADAVVRWLDGLPDDSWKTLIITHACTQNTESTHDPRIALQLVNLLPEGERREDALHHTGRRLAQIDSEKALELLSLETSPQARGSIMSGFAETFRGDSLVTALRQIQSDPGVLSGVMRWSDPATAVQWAVQQPNNESYLPRIAGAWMVKEPERGEEFARTLSPELRASAFSNAIESSLVWWGQPQEQLKAMLQRASQWIPEIADPTARQSAYRKIGERWIRFDPEPARRWIESAPLSSEVKSELLKLEPVKQ